MAITDYPMTTKFHEIDRVHPQPHSGLDLAVPYNSRIESQDRATVTVTHDDWLGDAVRLKLDNGDIIVYGHLSKVDVGDNQIVNAGDLLGMSGGIPNANQGKSTAPHVHVSQYHEGVLIDPYNYLFHHQQIQSNSSSGSPLVVPVLLILLCVIIYKFKRVFAYGFGICAILAILFIIS